MIITPIDNEEGYKHRIRTWVIMIRCVGYTTAELNSFVRVRTFDPSINHVLMDAKF